MPSSLIGVMFMTVLCMTALSCTRGTILDGPGADPATDASGFDRGATVDGSAPDDASGLDHAAFGSDGAHETADVAASTDLLPPAGTIVIANGATVTAARNVSLRLRATDDGQVAAYQLSEAYSPGPSTARPWVDVTRTDNLDVTVGYTLSLGDGPKTIFAWFRDTAGRISPVANDTISLVQRPFPRTWRRLLLRSQAQRDAGHIGGEGMQWVISAGFTSDPRIVYFVSDTAQTWRSDDSGRSWVSRRNGFRPPGGVSLVVDPKNPDVVFVSGSMHVIDPSPNAEPSPVIGIYRTLDGADSWQHVFWTPYFRGDALVPKQAGYRPSEGHHFAFDLQSFDGVRHRTVYAATHTNGLLRSHDGGDTWHALLATTGTVALRGERVRDIEAHTTPAGVVLYVATLSGFWRVIDPRIGPATVAAWGNLDSIADASLRDLAIVTPDDNPDHDIIYAAAHKARVLKSVDGGRTFVDPDPSTSSPIGIRGALFVDVSPADPNAIFTTTAWGVFRSMDAGATWSGYADALRDVGCLSTLCTRGVQSQGSNAQLPAALHPTDSQVLLTQSYSTPMRSEDGGATWHFSSNGYGAAMRRINKTSSAFVNRNRFVFFLIDHGPIQTLDGGSTWRLLPVEPLSGPPGDTGGQHTTPVGAIDPSDPQLVLSAVGQYQGHRIERSTDGGATWTVLSDPINEGFDKFVFMAFDPTNPRYVFASAAAQSAHEVPHSWVSSDRGLTWRRIDRLQVVNVIAVGNASYVIAVEPIPTRTANGIEVRESVLHRSVDRTSSWTRIVTVRQNSNWWVDIEADPGDPTRIYVGTSNGVAIVEGTQWNPPTASVGPDTGPCRNHKNSRYVSSLVVDPNPNRSRKVYAAFLASGCGQRERFVYESTDFARTWADIGYNLGAFSSVNSLAIHPDTGDLYLSMSTGHWVLPF